MTLTRWDPFSEMTSLRQAMDRLLTDSFIDFGGARTLEGMSHIGMGGIVPIDMIERDDALVVTVSLPGAKPEEVDVSVHRNLLTIKGEMRRETGGSGDRYHLRERWQGSFSRQISLPVEVSEDACDATFEDGVLTITLPKSAQSRGKRIGVRGSGPAAIEGEKQSAQDGTTSQRGK